MKSKWPTRSLGELVHFTSGGTPSKKRDDYWKGDIPWISAKTLKSERITTSDLFISEDGLNAGSKIAPLGSILLLTRGSGLFNGIPVGLVEREVAFNQDIKCLDSYSDVENKFIFYWLISQQKYLMAKVGVTGIGAGKFELDFLQKLEVPIPSKDERAKIVAFIDILTDKIELNRRIDLNLQQQAQTLYYEWFVASLSEQRGKFQKVSLADLLDYAGGSQPPASEFISEARKGYVRFVQIRDYESDSHVTYIPVSPKNKLCNEQDIMIARYGAALGRICFGLNGAYNVALAKVFPKQAYYREFLRCYLSSREFYEGINNKGGRSAQAGFNQSDIKSFEVYIPIDKATIYAFESVAAPLFEQRLHIIKENKTLGFLRDSLLPKLMSGEIDVSNIL